VTNATPPGWYPDPWNRSAQRFWDGGQWTDHVALAAAPGARPRLPEGAPVYGPWIWILALLPLLGGIAVWFIHIDVSGLVDLMRRVSEEQQAGGPVVTVDPASIYGGGYWVSAAVGWGGYAAAIVLAVFDARRLRRIGVERPFSWGWAFLMNIVYVIGRSVVVRRVASPRGLAPIWVLIAAYVVAIVSSAIWLASWVGPLIEQAGNSYPTA